MLAHRLGMTAVAVVAVSALGGCGDGDSNTVTSASGGAATPSLSPSSAPSTTAPARPWVGSCALITDADVLAATAHPRMTVTIVNKEERDSSSGSVHSSTCRYQVRSVEKTADGELSSTGSGNAVSFAVQDTGGVWRFQERASHGDALRVTGVGDEAFWDLPDNDILHVRKDDMQLKFSSSAATPTGTDILPGRREVTLKLARLVTARL